MICWIWLALGYDRKENLFHPNNHGGLVNHSTCTAIIQLQDIWINAAENKELSATCFLDQSSAYNLLCHKILGDKLGHHKLDYVILRRKKSVCTDWRQS